MVGVPFAAEDFDLEKVPDHLKVTFRVTDERRRALAESKDLEELRLRLRDKTQAAITRAFESRRRAAGRARRGAAGRERRRRARAATGAPRARRPGLSPRTGLTDWTLGTLPRIFETRRSRPARQGVPGAGGRRRLRLRAPLRHEAEQQQAMWARHAPADPAQHPVRPGQVRRVEDVEPAEARALPLTARQRAGPLRGLCDGGGGPAHRAFTAGPPGTRRPSANSSTRYVRTWSTRRSRRSARCRRCWPPGTPASSGSGPSRARCWPSPRRTYGEQVGALICPGFVTGHGAAPAAATCCATWSPPTAGCSRCRTTRSATVRGWPR